MTRKREKERWILHTEFCISTPIIFLFLSIMFWVNSVLGIGYPVSSYFPAIIYNMYIITSIIIITIHNVYIIMSAFLSPSNVLWPIFPSHSAQLCFPANTWYLWDHSNPWTKSWDTYFVDGVSPTRHTNTIASSIRYRYDNWCLSIICYPWILILGMFNKIIAFLDQNPG